MKTITILLPTYNRSEAVKFFLKNSNLNQFDYIIVSIHDGSDNAETEEVVSQFKTLYSDRLKYYKYPSTLDADSRIIEAIKTVKTDYLWLASDGAVIKPSSLEAINEYLDQCFDVVHLDVSDPLKLGNYIYKNSEDMFQNNFWSITGYGATIIKTHLLCDALNEDYESDIKKKYSQKCAFLWPCMIFDLISQGEFKLVHLQIPYYNSNPFKKSSGWLTSGKALDVWVDTLIEDIDNLPMIYSRHRNSVCKSVWDNTGLNNYSRLLAMRRWKCISLAKVRERDKKGYLDTVTRKKYRMYLMCFFPVYIAKIVSDAYHVIKAGKEKKS